MIYGAQDEYQKPGTLHKKSNRNVCSNYKGIALLRLAYKLCTAIVKVKLQPNAEEILTEEQCGFHKGRSCTDTVFTLKQIMEKSIEFNLPLYLLFLNYE
jgi:hypothetical protein